MNDEIDHFLFIPPSPSTLPSQETRQQRIRKLFELDPALLLSRSSLLLASFLPLPANWPLLRTLRVFSLLFPSSPSSKGKKNEWLLLHNFEVESSGTSSQMY